MRPVSDYNYIRNITSNYTTRNNKINHNTIKFDFYSKANNNYNPDNSIIKNNIFKNRVDYNYKNIIKQDNQ